MQQTVPVHGNPENKVFGLKGSIVGTNLGKLFVKQDKDTLNVGWGELTSVVTTTASPITTTTAGGTTTTTAGGTTTTAGGTTTTTAGGTTTTAGGTTTTAGGTTTTEEVTTTTEEGGTTTTDGGPPGTYTEVSINFSPDPINAPERFDVSAVANVSGLVFISHELFIQASYEDLGPGIPDSGYTSIVLNTSPSGPEGTDTISVSNAQNTVDTFSFTYYVYVKSVLTTNGGVFESKTGGLKQYGSYPGLLSAPATEGFESFP